MQFLQRQEERYLARKRREIELLDGCLARPLALPPATHIGDVIEQKLKLAAALRAEQSLQSWAITETARPEARRWRTGAFHFSFGYQRADLEVRGPPIYPSLEISPGRVGVETLYTGSGMGAIAALLAGLTQARGVLAIHRPAGGYGETRELLERFGDRIARLPRPGRRATSVPGNALRILWVDSAVRDGLAPQLRGAPTPLDLVVCDTTCWAQSSGRIRRMVAWALARSLPLIMVRSHAKLDCIGIEYGRLGSVVLAWDRRGAHDWMRAVVREVRESIRLFGTAPIPAHFPPFTGADAYRGLSAARTAAIIRNVRRLSRRLASTPLRECLTEYDHGLYLTLSPRGELRVRDVKRAVDAMCRTLCDAGLPVRHAGSFGFDFTALEWFPDPLTRRNAVRIAPGDLPAETLDLIADGVAAWFAQQDGRAPRRRARATSVLTLAP